MPCMCGATDCPSCGPAQGYYGETDEEVTEADGPDEPEFDGDLADAEADRCFERLCEPRY